MEEGRKLFVAGISHELKTPISVIRGYAEVSATDLLFYFSLLKRSSGH